MKDKKNVFDLTFKGKNGDWDWNFTLYTTELKTEDEIKSLINNCVIIFNTIEELCKVYYTPVCIMDSLCKLHKDEGWYWTDKEDKSIVITDW